MTVYAVHQQMKYDETRRVLAPRFSTIDKAKAWGYIVYLLPPGAHPYDPELVLGSMHEKLSGFSNIDHLLLIGNPVLMGMATAIASYYNDGAVRFLQWSDKNNTYAEISAKIY